MNYVGILLLMLMKVTQHFLLMSVVLLKTLTIECDMWSHIVYWLYVQNVTTMIMMYWWMQYRVICYFVGVLLLNLVLVMKWCEYVQWMKWMLVFGDIYNIYRELLERCEGLTQSDAVVGDIFVIDQNHTVIVNISSLQELVCESSVNCPSLVKDRNIDVSFGLTMILELF